MPPANFDLKDRLGSGHFGEVWRVIDTGLGTTRAVKLIPPSKITTPNNFFQEAQTLKAVEHPNIVRVEETGTMPDGRIYVAMEYLPKGSLEDEAKGAYVPLSRAQRVMVDVLRGLEYAHLRGVLHRDIKPANILIGDDSAGKLSDFGLAIPMGVNLKSLGVKDYAYLAHVAPEVHQKGPYSIQTDIYACGVTLYRLVNGDSYLPALAPPDIRDQAIKGNFPDRGRYREFIPRSVRSVINRAMDADPAKRFRTAERMRHAIEKIPLHMNWNERILPDGYQWTCGFVDKRCYEVTRSKNSGGKWNVIVRKGKAKRGLRRVNKLCAEGLSKARAESATRRILQDFVAGKLE